MYQRAATHKTGGILAEKMRMMNEYSGAELQNIGFYAKDRADLDDAQPTSKLTFALSVGNRTLVNINDGTIEAHWKLTGPGFNMNRLSDIEFTLSVSGTGQYKGPETKGKTITGTFNGSGIMKEGGTFDLTLKSSVIGTEMYTANVAVLDNNGRLLITGLENTFSRVNTGTVKTTITITQIKAKMDGASTATVVWTGSTKITDSYNV